MFLWMKREFKKNKKTRREERRRKVFIISIMFFAIHIQKYGISYSILHHGPTLIITYLSPVRLTLDVSITVFILHKRDIPSLLA